MPKKSIFLDYNSTTPVDPEVFEVMKPYFLEKFGNPSSPHLFGIEALAAIDLAREKIAQLLGEKNPETIIFTGSATESNNLALKGLAESFTKPIHIITQQTEHSCVLEPCQYLANQGHQVTILPVNSEGFIDINDLKNSIQHNTQLVSIMFANNEIGTIQPIKEIANLCKDKKIIFHTDATQAVGKIAINLSELKIDLMSFSAHKIYGPKGIGALYINLKNPKLKLNPQIHGGGHEKNLRSGTLNTPGIIGFAKALEISLRDLISENNRLLILRKYLLESIQKQRVDVILNGAVENRLINNLNFSIPDINANQLMPQLIHLGISTGSACASETGQLSHVLSAITSDENRIKSSFRIGLGRYTSKEEIDYFLENFLLFIKK